ncbi:sigma-70 family RNA polymerase sigma factor [Herbaspirillum sp. alder98]|uniref:sigma-70 family RNA polymerase sigma factor n=1 Tax=Herbaspirillum sp. alder98 TaxID=2913096 RepID=UPI001CD910E2|nr:sigma-70 family RNA polymerase sigma factor [Herbaspirillum sp. alder98]MCA1323840.1 sigma-70 family RNA polymerase sigma factor [Herbaspirillum sp. alder98]
MSQDFTDDDLRELMPRLRRFAASLTRNEASADDLVQSCLERALSRRRQHTDGDLRAWLFQIMYRRFVDSQRRTKRYAGLLALLLPRDEALAPSTEDIVLSRAALADFNKLTPEQRALLLLVSVEGLSYQEAAHALDLPIGTVMSRLSRARCALRELNDGARPASPLRIMK